MSHDLTEDQKALLEEVREAAGPTMGVGAIPMPTAFVLALLKQIGLPIAGTWADKERMKNVVPNRAAGQALEDGEHVNAGSQFHGRGCDWRTTFEKLGNRNVAGSEGDEE